MRLKHVQSHMVNLQTPGVPIENQRGQGGGLRLFWNRVIKTKSLFSLLVYMLSFVIVARDGFNHVWAWAQDLYDLIPK